MERYKKMYLLLFHAITDALSALDEQNIGSAKEILKLAQQHAEDIYVAWTEETD